MLIWNIIYLILEKCNQVDENGEDISVTCTFSRLYGHFLRDFIEYYSNNDVNSLILKQTEHLQIKTFPLWRL